MNQRNCVESGEVTRPWAIGVVRTGVDVVLGLCAAELIALAEVIRSRVARKLPGKSLQDITGRTR